MLAMPGPFSSSEPPQQAVLQFVGPMSMESSPGNSSLLSRRSSSSEGTIYLRGPGMGALNPIFSVRTSKHKPNVVLSKIVQDGTSQHLGEASNSSMSSKITLSLRGQEAAIKEDLSRKLMIPSVGEFKIRSSSSDTSFKFIDPQKVEVAKYSWSEGEPKLDIYVPNAGDFLIEMFVLSAVALMQWKKKEANAAKGVFEVVNALAGV